MDSHSVFQALQLAVSPVILISAYGLLLLSMTNRLGRAIDRARLLVREGAAKARLITVPFISRMLSWAWPSLERTARNRHKRRMRMERPNIDLAEQA